MANEAHNAQAINDAAFVASNWRDRDNATATPTVAATPTTALFTPTATATATATSTVTATAPATATQGSYVCQDPFILDDGSVNSAIGQGGGGQFLWLNRFTPSSFPVVIDEVQIYFGGFQSVSERRQ